MESSSETTDRFHTDGGASRSVWMDDVQRLVIDSPELPTRVDVCVVGAGIAGLSVAYQLVKSGRSVAIVDDGVVAGGETCRTTAHITYALDDRYFALERLHGREGARRAAESHSAALVEIATSSRRRKSPVILNGWTGIFLTLAETETFSPESCSRLSVSD